MTTALHDQGWSALMRGRNGPRMLVITGGVALHAVSIYVVATILPLVVHDVGGLAFLAWTYTLYVAGSLCGASLVPLLLSRRNARFVYRLAFGLFLTGSLVCALAPGMGVLLLGRLSQGLGGGMLPALAYATIRSSMPGELHARAIAFLSTVWGIAALAGPAVGGLFAALDAWRWAFGIDVVIGVVFIAAAESTLRRDGRSAVPARPFPGLRLLLLVLAALSVGWGGATARAPQALLGLFGAVVCLIVMLRLDGASAPRMLPSGAYRPTRPLGAVSATMGLLFLSASPNTFIPYLLDAGHGIAPIVGGYVNATYALSWTFASLFTASAGRTGARISIGLGPVFMLAGMVLQSWAVTAGQVSAVLLGQVLLGAGIGMGWAHLGALLLAVAPPDEHDVAGPFITTTQTLAALFGSAIAGMVANLAGLADAATAAEVAATGHWLFGTLTVLPLAACATAWYALTFSRDTAR
jgi:MFS family permease